MDKRATVNPLRLPLMTETVISGGQRFWMVTMPGINSEPRTICLTYN